MRKCFKLQDSHFLSDILVNPSGDMFCCIYFKSPLLLFSVSAEQTTPGEEEGEKNMIFSSITTRDPTGTAPEVIRLANVMADGQDTGYHLQELCLPLKIHSHNLFSGLLF